jgi:hypothetical protein
MDCVLFVLTFLAALGSALIGGLFFAFSAFVMRALGRLPPAGGIAAMQSINVAVLNPVFFRRSSEPPFSASCSRLPQLSDGRRLAPSTCLPAACYISSVQSS